MEVVVYDENINNINTYFNDYIVDHIKIFRLGFTIKN